DADGCADPPPGHNGRQPIRGPRQEKPPAFVLGQGDVGGGHPQMSAADSVVIRPGSRRGAHPVRTRALIAMLALAAVAPAACGTTQEGPRRPTQVASARHRAEAAKLLTWAGHHHVRGVVDLTAPRADSSIVVAAAGKLQLLAPGGGLSPFAPRYAAPPGLEPYVALSSAQRVSDAGCRFPADNLYALRLNHG